MSQMTNWGNVGELAPLVLASSRVRGGLSVEDAAAEFKVDPTRLALHMAAEDHAEVKRDAERARQQREARERESAEPPSDDIRSQVQRRLDELAAQVLDVAGLRAIQPPTPLVQDYLYRDSLAWLQGKPGHAKSFVGVDLACCIATGIPWQDHPVKAGRVLYLIAEGASGLGLRVDAWALAHGVTPTAVMFLPVPVQILESVDLSAFASLAQHRQVDLIVIDTQARVTVGAEENSAKDMGRFVESLEQIRRHTGACVLVVHHESRSGENLRGSTALEGAATTILRAAKDGPAVEISNPKQKDAPEQPPMTLALSPLGDSAVLSREAATILGATTTESENALLTVLASFASPPSKTDLKEASGQSKTTFYRSINALVTKGLALEEKQGNTTRYSLPTESTQGTLDEDNETVTSVPRGSWDSSTVDGVCPTIPTESHGTHTTPDQQLSQIPTESQKPATRVPCPTPPIGGGTSGKRDSDKPCDKCTQKPTRISHTGARWCQTCAPWLWKETS